jgi:hypothetical protein
MRTPVNAATVPLSSAQELDVYTWTDRKANRIFWQLRAYYRANFVNGNSDEMFLLWVEECLKESS